MNLGAFMIFTLPTYPVLEELHQAEPIGQLHFPHNTVSVPYKWKYKMDTIHLEDEDVSQIVYEVVNAKAASLENEGKCAPILTRRKGKEQNQDCYIES